MVSIDDIAPDFELLDSEGKSEKLSDFRGQKIVLFFYPKAGTSGCTTQACGFRDSFPIIQAADATVIGVSPDEPPALKKWKAAEKLPYMLLSDPNHAVAEKYGVWGEKKMYGRSYMGIIRSHFIIDEEGRIVDVQIKISPKNSIKQALASLESGSISK
ncbi:MAG: thioredoxin-dependent thiol peroxidase [Anaerolineae bacterium]|nr:MAG: thioredoxin-dependent thiol peroxidase [Anaerolineae bacterium]